MEGIGERNSKGLTTLQILPVNASPAYYHYITGMIVASVKTLRPLVLPGDCQPIW